jgi:hypothetical protein
MIDISHMLPHVMWLIVTWAKSIMVNTCVDNKYNMTKISQWNYACNISMIKMSRGRYTCSKDDGNMTNSNMWPKLVTISACLDKRLVIWLKPVNYILKSY